MADEFKTTRVIGSGAVSPAGKSPAPLPPVKLEPKAANPEIWQPDASAARTKSEPTQVMGALKSSINQALTDAVAKLAPQAPMAVKPTDLLKQVRNAELELRLPLKAGVLYEGMLGIDLAKALENTTMTVHCTVKEGVPDLDRAKVTFDPPLDGPLWTTVPKVSVRGGKVTLQVTGSPDVNVGPTLPSTMEGLAQTLEELQQSPRMSAGMLGLDLVSIKNPVRGALETGGKHVDVARAREAQVSLTNVTFKGGTITLAGLGQLELQPGSKVSVTGSLEDLTIKGSVGFTKLALARDGIAVSGGSGSADLSMRLQQKNGQGTVSTSLERLNLALDSAVTRRTNGDVLALGSGKVTNGSLAFTTAVSGPGLVASQPGASTLERLHIGQFEGTLVGARVTVPDAKDTAQVRVAKATMKGSLTIDADRILVEGKLSDVQAEVADYQGGVPGASMDLRTVGVSGGGAVKLDSQVGLSMDGALKLDVDIAAGTVGSGAAGVGTNVADGSRMIMTGNHLAVTADALQAKGAAQVDLKLTDVKVGAAGVKLEAREANVQGNVGEASLDSSRGVELVKTGKMSIDATLSGGQISFGDGGTLALDGGTKLKTALTQAVFDGAGLRADFARGTELDAVLSEGSLELLGNNNNKVSLQLAGAKAKFRFEKLSYDSAGKTVAAGTMELTALLNSQRLALPGLEELTGLKLNPANLEHASVSVNSNFDLRPDSFALTKLRVRLESALSKVTGRL